MAQSLEGNSFDRPASRPFTDGTGKVDVETVGRGTMGRGRFEPGWRWS